MATLAAARAACELPVARLHCIADDMQAELRKGLAADGCALMQLPSHVTQLPDGSERGAWFALDLGGTNFRVLRLQLSDAAGAVEHVQSEEVAIPGALLTGTVASLFGFIASRVVSFTGRDAEGALGFTFSFACAQTALDAGTLLGWTKGFALVDGVGCDVVALLRAALAAAGSCLRVAALVNDTVGTLAAARYADAAAVVAVILGTGTNAAYLEEVRRVPKLAAAGLRTTHMIMNTEWGGFAGASLPRLPADAAVDAASVNPGAQAFEKLVSGLYLGRIVAAIALAADAEAAPPALDGAARDALARPNAVPTPLVSQLCTAAPEGAAALLHDALGVPLAPPAVALLAEVAALVSRRAARLAAAGVVAVLAHMGAAHPPSDAPDAPPPPTIAVDGGLFEHHTVFAAQLRAAVAEMGVAAQMRLTPDGSGVGAALLAAAASRA